MDPEITEADAIQKHKATETEDGKVIGGTARDGKKS